MRNSGGLFFLSVQFVYTVLVAGYYIKASAAAILCWLILYSKSSSMLLLCFYSLEKDGKWMLYSSHTFLSYCGHKCIHPTENTPDHPTKPHDNEFVYDRTCHRIPCHLHRRQCLGMSPLSHYMCSTNTCALMMCCIVAAWAWTKNHQVSTSLSKCNWPVNWMWMTCYFKIPSE